MLNKLNKNQLSSLCVLLTAIAIASVQLYVGLTFIILAFFLWFLQFNSLLIFKSAEQVVQKMFDNEFEFPPKTLLKMYKIQLESQTNVLAKVRTVKKTLKGFGINVNFYAAKKSPVLTQLQFQVENTRLTTKSGSAKITNIMARKEDIRLALKTNYVNFIPVVEGTNCFGVEIPNQKTSKVGLLNLLNEEKFRNFVRGMQINLGETSLCNGLPLAMGFTEDMPLYLNLTSAPHVLISGATGSGKTSLIHAIINSLIFYHTPETLELYLVDGKTTELTLYENLPHLKHKIITSFDAMASMLTGILNEVARRNELLKAAQKRDIYSYNNSVKNKKDFLPYIVIIADEYAELTMQSNSRSSPEFSQFETTIVRLGQLARSAGIHLILSTQRPDKKIVTPLLKANIPTRVCFKVTDKTNSMVVIDQVGGELLTGKGDGILLLDSKPIRFQAIYLEDNEILNVVKWWINFQNA